MIYCVAKQQEKLLSLDFVESVKTVVFVKLHPGGTVGRKVRLIGVGAGTWSRWFKENSHS